MPKSVFECLSVYQMAMCLQCVVTIELHLVEVASPLLTISYHRASVTVSYICMLLHGYEYRMA